LRARRRTAATPSDCRCRSSRNTASRAHGSRTRSPQLPGLTVCTWPALACRPLDLPFGDAMRQDWTLAGDALWLIVETGRGQLALVRFHPSTGRETARVALKGEALVTAVGAGPGGVPLFAAREERTQVDLMVARR
jgi:hypothetical protein